MPCHQEGATVTPKNENRFGLACTFAALGTLLALSQCARSDDFTTLEIAYDVAATADMLTTLDIKKHPALMETNPIMGQHPSDAKVLTYFAATDILHAMVTHELVQGNAPSVLIKAWEYVSIGVETGFAAHNYSIGLRVAL
jgi:hypothetical protein